MDDYQPYLSPRHRALLALRQRLLVLGLTASDVTLQRDGKRAYRAITATVGKDAYEVRCYSEVFWAVVWLIHRQLKESGVEVFASGPDVTDFVRALSIDHDRAAALAVPRKNFDGPPPTRPAQPKNRPARQPLPPLSDDLFGPDMFGG